jgi:hypothetical protein
MKKNPSDFGRVLLCGLPTIGLNARLALRLSDNRKVSDNLTAFDALLVG